MIPLPCPFCGVPGTPDCMDAPMIYYIACDNLECHIKPIAVGDSAQEAMEAWNKRA